MKMETSQTGEVKRLIHGIASITLSEQEPQQMEYIPKEQDKNENLAMCNLCWAFTFNETLVGFLSSICNEAGRREVIFRIVVVKCCDGHFHPACLCRYWLNFQRWMCPCCHCKIRVCVKEQN